MSILYNDGEFSHDQSVDVRMYNLFEDSQVFVIWKWMWIEESGSESDEIHDRKTDSDSGSNIDSSEDEDGDSAITHRVVFKCIGCTKEHHYHVILAEVTRRMRQCEEVPVKVVYCVTRCTVLSSAVLKHSHKQS